METHRHKCVSVSFLRIQTARADEASPYTDFPLSHRDSGFFFCSGMDPG